MEPANMGAHGFELFRHRFDDQQPFPFIAYLPFPSIDRTDAWNDADTGGMSGLNQGGSNTLGRFGAIRGCQNKNRIHDPDSSTKRLQLIAVAQYHAPVK